MGKPTGLAPEQQRALGRLKRLAPLRKFYLAGGTAIGWHLHHRVSNDLDLFSESRVDLGLIEQAVTALSGVSILSVTEVTLKIKLDGALVDFVSYPYSPLEKPKVGPAGFRVAGLLDLSVMKLAAVARRGIRRDFWDLRVIIEHGISLEEAAHAYVRRFRAANGDLYPVFRSLTYFADADKDEVFPAGMTRRSWESTKKFFRVHGAKALRSLLAEP